MTRLRILRAFLRRNALIETSYRMQLVLTVGGTIASIATFYFVAQLVNHGALPMRATYGRDYFPFVLVGLAVAQYSTVALYGLAGQIRQEQLQGTLEAMLVHPIRPLDVALGLPAWQFCWTAAHLALYLWLGMWLFHCDLSRANWPGAALVFASSALIFCALGMGSAACVLLFKRGNPLQWALNTAFVLLGGVYFPITLLPPPLASVARTLPLTYLLHGLRRALLEGAPLTQLAPAIGVIWLFGLALWPLGLWALSTALQRSRARGGLIAY